MQVSITLKNQEDAGDDNFKQTYYYAKETRNYSVYFFKTDDIQRLLNYLLCLQIKQEIVEQVSLSK